MKRRGPHLPARPLLLSWLGLLLVTSLTSGCSQTALSNEEDVPPPTDAQQVALCHTQDGQSYVLHRDHLDRLVPHLLHGDGVPLGPVPHRPGVVFSGTCAFASDTGSGACPAGMAHIDGFCIDRWEAHVHAHSPYDIPQTGTARTAPQIVPQAYISADVAEAACQAAGKRLCTSSEWIRACRGRQPRAFPYGTTYVANACNEGRSQHPVVELFGEATDWSARQMNDPRLNRLPHSLDPTGSNPACMTPEGVYDLHGNLHEWVADSDGTFRGGFYVDAEINGQGCSYRTTAHGRQYHDYSTGFRCCSEVR